MIWACVGNGYMFGIYFKYNVTNNGKPFKSYKQEDCIYNIIYSLAHSLW